MEEEYIVSLEKIIDQIEMWVEFNLSTGFTFRKHQKEAIANIIDKIVNNKNHNIIVEAPTGSGKSLINIIASQVLWQFYHIDSYILCSDLYLFDQYDKFVDQNPQLTNIATIKGLTGNYTCQLNKEDIRSAECGQCGISWSKLMYAKGEDKQELFRKGFRCLTTCPYVKARRKALNSPVVITTYQNLLYQLNILYQQKQKEGCSESSSNKNCLCPKQVIFCDEAHNIPNVVQLKYTPEIRHTDLNKLLEVFDYYGEMKRDPNFKQFEESMFDESFAIVSGGHQMSMYDEIEGFYQSYTRDSLIEEFNKVWAILCTPNPPLDELAISLHNYGWICTGIKLMTFLINSWISTHKKSRYDKLDDKMSKMWKTNIWLGNYVCSLADFVNAIESKDVGPEYILKKIHETNIEFKKSLFSSETDEDPRVITLNCMKENFLVYCGLLSWAKFRVFTSATIGGQDNFCDNNGIHYTEDEVASFDRIPSIFNFDKSPINFLNRYSMAFKDRNYSIPKICKLVQKLCKRHQNEKGIIQTGSYALTKQLIESLDKETQSRLLTYNGSRDKIKKAEIHRCSQNTILIGPSLNQGIDLPDDNVRFIIILKVPYPSITDEYVKQKVRLFPRWYESTTATEIIQGIGRGVRNEDDWCVTYILDSCFYKLYSNTIEQFSDEMKNRIKIFN